MPVRLFIELTKGWATRLLRQTHTVGSPSGIWYSPYYVVVPLLSPRHLAPRIDHSRLLHEV